MPQAQAKEVKTAKIIVSKIYEPSGAGPYRIFDKSTRQYWKVWKDKLEELDIQENGTYAIMYTPGTYNGKPDNTIIGAQSIDTTVASTISQLASTVSPSPVALSSAVPVNQEQADREKNIIVEALAKCPRLVELAEAGDRAGIAHILNNLWDGWRLFKQPQLKQPTRRQSVMDDIDDEIPI